MGGKELKTGLSATDASYGLNWEFFPLRTDRGTSSSPSSSPKRVGGTGSVCQGKKVTATIQTSLPPGVRVSQNGSSGVFGAGYSNPSLTLVETERGGENDQVTGKNFVVLNWYDVLHIVDKVDPEASPVHTISFGGICPTCHAGQQVNFTMLPPIAGDHDYAVGLATGELLSFSMRHHIRQNITRVGGGADSAKGSPGKDTVSSKVGGVFSSQSKGGGGTSKVKITAVKYYNRDRAAETGRCTAISWSPRSVSNKNDANESNSARVLVAAFVDGSLHVYSPNGGVLSSHTASSPEKIPTTPSKGSAETGGSGDKGGKELSLSSSGGSSFFSSLRRNKSDSNGNNNTNASSASSDSKDGLGVVPSQPGTPQVSKAKGSDDSSDACLVVQWNVCNGVAINSVAFSNDGYQLACVSCDGVLRIFDVGSGTLRAGCRSYFGGYLCVSWSQDSRFVVCGGEDDLVEIFSIADNCLVAFGEGHRSWVSDLAFLSVTEQSHGEANKAGSGEEDEAEGDTDISSERLQTRMYKFLSVGQDTQVALWEFEAPDDIDDLAADKTTTRPRHRRWVSTGGTNSTPMKLSFDGIPAGTAAIAIPNSPGADQQDPDLEVTPTSVGEPSRTTSASQSLIAGSVPRAQMEMIPSVAQQEAHGEPLLSVLKVGDGFVTLCVGAILKFWRQQE